MLKKWHKIKLTSLNSYIFFISRIVLEKAVNLTSLQLLASVKCTKALPPGNQYCEPHPQGF